MKTLLKFSAIIAAAVFIVPAALAQTCPTPPTGLHCLGSYCWYNYTPDAACMSTSGSVSSTTVSCYNAAAWAASTGTMGYIWYSFEADPSLADWDATTYVEFNDPQSSPYNWIELWATVTHNGSTSYTQLFAHDGTMGSLSCDRYGGPFTASEGDIVTIEIFTNKYDSNATIKATRPVIMTTY